ncbi:Hypothetical predicted protein [Paramuricea clavata]|uniref:Uncharacterized protein n=1 Tax=Paramuricea clavata TaxID=317549 RepID=A0A7D9I713_PARCT|nr:Hypothetical predicted protein [Paramuricea clavata]
MAVLTEESLDINEAVEEGINKFNMEEKLPSFFLTVLDRAEYLICNDSRNITFYQVGNMDNIPENVEFYGYDPHGSSPFEDSNNNVVQPVNIANGNEVQAEILQVIDPLMPSVQMGIDIHEEVLRLSVNYAHTEQ